MASSTALTAPSASPVKILTVGSAVGSIRDLFVKIKAINAKHGKFDCVLCTGDFFGPLKEPGASGDGTDEIEQLLNGDIEVPLKCYIMQGENPLPDSVIEKYAKTSGELCKDVFLLNKSGIMTTAHGLRIACLGGVYNPGIYTTAEAPPGFASPFFSAHTVERLLSNTLVKSSSKSQSKNQTYTSLTSILNASSSSQLIDILITNDWPACITRHSSAPLPFQELSPVGATPLDEVIRKVQPRYHFAALGGRPPQFWEREPFVWDGEAGRVSRFVSLGAFGAEATGGKKPRWFYAFSITPPSPSNPAPVRPTNATKNPFTELAPRPQKRTLETFETGENFIWGNVPQPGKRLRTDAPPGEEGKPPPGYKCRRCDSTEHFITSCPERQKPPEGYVCRICNTPGHLVRDCPTRHAVGDTGGRKPRPGYVCRACASEEHYIEDCPVANAGQRGGERRGRRDQVKEIGPDECWFCLSNPNLAKHLIVSIGSECYVTLPKGQIIPTQSNIAGNDSNISTVPGGGHVLIVPISHHPTYNTIPADIAPPILEETDKYKSSLRALYAAHNASAVFFEVGRLSTKGGHAHVQAVPVPTSLAGKVEEAFRSQGINFDGTLEDCQSAGLPDTMRGRSYFRVDLPDGRTLVHLIEEHAPFGVQFGRQVLTDLLGIPDRVDWKACMLPEEEDKADVKAFKAAFASFDPSM